MISSTGYLPGLQTAAQAAALDESCVYVHLEIHTSLKPILVRIWPTTFLIDRASGHRSALIHAENITYAPEWTPIPSYTRYKFLLIFTGLPRGCTRFDLVEEAGAGEGDAFRISSISRNETDVYWFARGV